MSAKHVIDMVSNSTGHFILATQFLLTQIRVYSYINAPKQKTFNSNQFLDYVCKNAGYLVVAR